MQIIVWLSIPNAATIVGLFDFSPINGRELKTCQKCDGTPSDNIPPPNVRARIIRNFRTRVLRRASREERMTTEDKSIDECVSLKRDKAGVNTNTKYSPRADRKTKPPLLNAIHNKPSRLHTYPVPSVSAAVCCSPRHSLSETTYRPGGMPTKPTYSVKIHYR